MNRYIAYCGLDCETCEARLATIRHDEVLREKVAALWSKLNGAEITPDMIRCTGCRIPGEKTPYCDSICPIRRCASEKGLETCGSCSEADSCERLAAIVRNTPAALHNLKGYAFLTLRECPGLMDTAAEWFHEKWHVPKEAYLDCMRAYLNGETEYGWFLCLKGTQIAGGLGVIENDFHERKDLTPNVCAVYTEPAHRNLGIAGRLLNMAVEDLRARGISPVYLVTDHTGFYERYSWEFLCLVHSDGEETPSRMYIHK